MGEEVPIPTRAFGNARVVLLMVVVPEFLPILTAVAAPPMLRLVAPVLNMLPVPAVVVMEPPLTATVPAVVILPLEPVIEKFVALTFPAQSERALTMCESERSIPVVIAPPPVEVIARPVGRVLEVA